MRKQLPKGKKKMNPHVFLNDPEQITAVESMQRVDEKGYLYHMECAYDYYSLPEMFQSYLDAGCSVFVTKNLQGETLFCRNYDYSHYKDNQKRNPRTGLNVIVEGNNPKAKYRSIGVSDAYWLDYRNGSFAEGMADDGKTDLSPFVLCPFLCMDGVNEKGLALAILRMSTDFFHHGAKFFGICSVTHYITKKTMKQLPLFFTRPVCCATDLFLFFLSSLSGLFSLILFLFFFPFSSGFLTRQGQISVRRFLPAFFRTNIVLFSLLHRDRKSTRLNSSH